MKKILFGIIGALLLLAATWAIVAAYQHYKRMGWRPPRVRLSPQTTALRKQLRAAIADGRGITNGVIHPKEDDYLKEGADPAELKKSRQIGEAIVNGDYASFIKLEEMEKVEAETFHAERTNWNHQQYNELAGPEQMKIFAPASFAEDIVISAGLRNYKNGLKAMDVAFEVPGARGIPMAFLNTLARRGNEAALEIFLNATNYGLPLSETIFPLKNAADNGDERAIDALAAICKNEKDKPLWFMAANALANAAADGNETAIDAVKKASAHGIHVDADTQQARNVLRQQMQRVIAENIVRTNFSVQSFISVNTNNSDIEKGRQLAEAIVNGDATGFEKLVELSKAEHESFNAQNVGLNYSASADLATKTFLPLWKAFAVLDSAAVGGNTNSLDTIAKAIEISELRGIAVWSLSDLARNGNVPAAEILINPTKYGLLPSANAGLLKSTADGLRLAAASGNEIAIDDLLTLSTNSDSDARTSAVTGIKEAATNQNAKAIEALQKLNAQ